MIRLNEKKSEKNAINAFNTGRSFRSGTSNKKIQPLPNIETSHMRLNSGDTQHRGNNQQMVTPTLDAGDDSSS